MDNINQHSFCSVIFTSFSMRIILKVKLLTYNLQLTTPHAFFTFFAGAAFVFVRLLSHILSLVASTCASVFLERTDFSFSVISSLLAYLSLCFISSQLFSPW